MKLTTLFLLAAFLQVSAKSISQQVNYRAKNEKIQNAFAAIEKQTGYVFFYRAQDLNKAVKVDVDINENNLNAALEKLLKNQPLQFRIEGKTVVITAKPAASLPNGSVTVEQSTKAPPPVTVRGKLTNENGEPLPGVTISVKGAKAIGSTDGNGEFIITVPDGNVTLVFTAVSIETYEVKLNGRTELALQANVKVTALQDIVVSKGYYSVKQRENTGNVSVVSGDDIRKQPVSDPVRALEGKVPGLYIQQFSGVPGSNSVVRLRGQNSIGAGNNPLYIIDGVPFGSISLSSRDISSGSPLASSGRPNGDDGSGVSPFNSLNPGDIENIEVLKDADATAIYGSMGANGVILITTKKGRAGDTRFSVNVSQGVGSVARTMPMLNTQQYLEMRREALKNDGVSAGVTDYDINGTWDTTRYTDWQKMFIGNAAQYTNVQGELSGGNQNTQFLVGVGYNRQTSVTPDNTVDKKGSVHFSLTHASTNKKLNLQLNANYVSGATKLGYADFTQFLRLAPDAPALYDASGNLNWQIVNGRSTFANPLANSINRNDYTTDNLISNFNISYQIIPGLSIKSNFGFNRIQMNQTNFFLGASLAPPLNIVPSYRSGQYSVTTSKSWIVEPQLVYQVNIGKGTLDATVGTTFRENNLNSSTQAGDTYSSDALVSNPLAAANFRLVNSSTVNYKYNAAFARISYNLSNKYLVNLTGRRDGSSRFGPGKQFGNFGAVGAGWIFSNENWIAKGLPFLSFGKLRASYGVVGNDQIGDYKYLSTYSSLSNTYQGITGLFPTILTNPNFGWEQIRKFEVGIELGFLRDAINFSASYFRNRTINQLIPLPLPTITGFASVAGYNLPGTIQNTGVEFTGNATLINSKQFTWKTNLNLTIPRNKLVAFPSLSTNTTYRNVYVVGEPLSILKTFHYTGVDPTTGLYTFQDVNKDGQLTSADYVASQPVTQKLFGGISNSFSYKGFQLDVFFQYVKQTLLNYQASFDLAGSVNQNQPVYVLGRWQKPGDINLVQRFATASNSAAYTQLINLQRPSDGIIEDGSFLRLKNVNFSYQLPSSAVKKMHLQNLRFYLQAQNLLTITKYRGMDPETSGLNLPPLRVITVGVQATL